MINITGATELLEAQQATFDALHMTIEQAQEALDIVNAELTALADSSTLEELQARNELARKVLLLQELLEKAQEKYDRIHEENGPLVYEDAERIIIEYRKSIRDKHVDDYAVIRQKEAEIKAIKETINQSERAERAAMHQFVSEVRQYFPKYFYYKDGYRIDFSTGNLSNYIENGSNAREPLFNQGGKTND